MGTIILGSAVEQKGITVNPRTVLYNGNNVKKIAKGEDIIWNFAIPLIPKMTSNTAPSGVASNSSSQGTDYHAYKAFDNITTTYWELLYNQSEKWIGYEFPYAVTVNSIDVQLAAESIPSGQLREQTVTLQGTNDEWNFPVTLGTVTITAAEAKTVKNAVINATAAYKYYRLYYSGYNRVEEYNFCTCASLQLNGY